MTPFSLLGLARRVPPKLAALPALVLAIGLPVLAEAQSTHEIVVTVSEVRALDRTDTPIGGPADFYARITIAGETTRTKFTRNQDLARPNWQVTKKVAPGKHDVKLEIFDRDALKADDLIDINRIANKRDLDFAVDTRRCRISGFASGYRCGNAIKRAGTERKKAEVTFAVDVRR